MMIRRIPITSEENDIVTAAMFWWKSHKPNNWSEEEHIANSTVNITNDPSNTHKELAQACANYQKYIREKIYP
jgi:hypothetical protein